MTEVTTICYGQKTEWKSRHEAEMFFLEGIASCEGAERDRYMNVYLALTRGDEVCTDH